MKKQENMMVNRRQALALGIASTAALGLAACGGSGSSTSGGDGSEGSGESVDVTVTVWGPQEDQSEDNGKWLQSQCQAFAEAHPEWNITFKYGVSSEGEVKDKIVTDPSAGADVYLYANDQIPELVKAGGIAELGGSTLDAIKANNSRTTVNTVTYEGSVYGVPFTGNTWFMYYDASTFSADDVTSLEAMLEKGKVAFPLDTPWYSTALYVGNGCTLFGEDGDDAEAGIDFGGEKAIKVTDHLVDLIKNKNFVNGNISTNADAKAFFSGTWDYEQAVDTYGDNLGIAIVPTILIDGEAKQPMAFAGSKVIGVNPATELYATHPEVAVALAAWLGGTDSQRAHYELRNIIPTDTNITIDDALAQAQMDTMNSASIVQPLQADMANFWNPMESMGKEIVAGTVTHDNAAEKTEAMNGAMNTSVVQ